MRDSMVFYRSFLTALKSLPDDLRAEVLMDILSYGLDGVEPQSNDGVCRAIFELVRPQIDANNQRYVNGCKGAEYGKMGGRPRKNNELKSPNETPMKPLKNPNETPNVNVNDNDNVNVNENVNENENENENVKEKGIAYAIPKKKSARANSDFEQFWEIYPKKKSKNQAKKAWEKLKPSSELVSTILDAVENQKRSNDWIKDAGKYIPYPATWLNAGAWEDEMEVNTRERYERLDGSEGFIAPDTSNW